VIASLGDASLPEDEKRGYSYLINITRSSRSKYAKAFDREDFEALPGRTEKNKVKVKKIEERVDAHLFISVLAYHLLT
jgi:hypothetical protein